MSNQNSQSDQRFSLDVYREVFEQVDDIILVLNQEGIIEYVNRALRKKLGESKKRFTGTNIRESLLTHDSEQAVYKPEELFCLRQFKSHYTLRNGDELHFEWKLKRFQDRDGPKILAVLRDVSHERKRQIQVENYTKHLQNMVFDHQQHLEQQKQQQDSLDRAKSLFISRVAHELRTPLTALRGYSELLDDEQLNPEERHKYIKVIRRNADEMLQMVDETLSMLKLEQDRYVINEQEIHFEQFIQEVIETCEVLAEQKGIDLNLKIADHIPPTIYSDPQIIRQILINLIGNAIKFTDKGQVILRIQLRRRHGGTQKTLYFYVEDTGHGIPAEKHQNVFERFEQHHTSQTIGQRGTGLGLPIARQLGKLLGGKTRLLHSTPNEGSTFTFSLPLKSPQQGKGKANEFTAGCW